MSDNKTYAVVGAFLDGTQKMDQESLNLVGGPVKGASPEAAIAASVQRGNAQEGQPDEYNEPFVAKMRDGAFFVIATPVAVGPQLIGVASAKELPSEE